MDSALKLAGLGGRSMRSDCRSPRQNAEPHESDESYGDYRDCDSATHGSSTLNRNRCSKVATALISMRTRATNVSNFRRHSPVPWISGKSIHPCTPGRITRAVKSGDIPGTQEKMNQRPPLPQPHRPWQTASTGMRVARVRRTPSQSFASTCSAALPSPRQSCPNPPTRSGPQGRCSRLPSTRHRFRNTSATATWPVLFMREIHFQSHADCGLSCESFYFGERLIHMPDRDGRPEI